MAAQVRGLLIALIITSLAAAGRAADPAPASATSAAESAKAAFEIRGIKGLWWEGLEKYRLALPWVAAHNMNFFMLCYSSFPASGKDWRADYSAEETAGFQELAKKSKRFGVELCLSFNPGIWSKPPLTYSSEADYQFAWKKVKTIHALGICSFSLCLDDINRALEPTDVAKYQNLQNAQVAFTNRLWADMKSLSPRPRLIFCPSAYTTEDAEKHLDYIKKIADLDPEIFIFWTGPVVCSPTITAADAEKFAQWVGRKPIVWDNYPVNDMFPWRPLIAPVKGRSADLGLAVAGLMANPMKQWEASKPALTTLATYLHDPVNYDPAAARTTMLEEYPPAQRPVIESLLAVYGTSFLGEKDYPPKPPRDHAAAAEALPKYRMLWQQLSARKKMTPLWEDIRPTLEADIKLLERLSRDRKTASPLKASGADFVGGAADLYGWDKYGREVNYVYAKPSGRDEMRVSFWPDASAPPAKLILTGRNDDHKNRVHLLVKLNDAVIFDGPAPFPSESFAAHDFPIAAAALRSGENVLSIRNAEEAGAAGMPPWIMVTEAELAR